MANDSFTTWTTSNRVNSAGEVIGQIRTRTVGSWVYTQTRRPGQRWQWSSQRPVTVAR